MALVDVFKRVFEFEKRSRYDPCDVAATIADRLGYGAHQSMSAAIDEPDLRFRHCPAESYRRGLKARILAGSGTAIHTKAFHFLLFHKAVITSRTSLVKSLAAFGLPAA